MTRALAIALLLAACVPTPGQSPETDWLSRYCAASTPALRAAIRSAMGLAPDQEMVCPST